MEKMTKNNPWKGLQFYQETDIIYGRDEEIKALYTRILYNTQTVVYGKSGIGKSSIINAGIIPRAKHDEMLPVAIRLAHTSKKNQTGTAPYVIQIFNRIKEEVIKVGGNIEEVVPHAVDHKETLWELLHRHRIWLGIGEKRKRLIPLLLFDQFEEIFTLEISNKRVESFFSELADLFNEVKPAYLTPTDDNKIDDNDSLKEGETEKKRNVFSKIANRKLHSSPEYLEKSEFHIVIILREDFLSYLERYTACIPVMKQNRFPLLPLNEEQAAKIITEPVKGLVQKDVAEVIIQRVTGCTDFKLDGIPEIEVDAALLSLYMEQLYERKGDDNNIISSELVQFNDDIIKEFYENSIKGISEKAIEFLEDELITNANRRNNVARIDLISGGVSEDDLDNLIEKKILRQFSYGGDFRVEFMHDILCPLVNNRILQRENKRRILKQKRKYRFIAIICTVISGLLLGLSIRECKKTKGDSILQGYLIIQEDSTISMTEYWKAEVLLTLGEDTVLRHVVDKVTPSCTFRYDPLDKRNPHLSIHYLIGNYRIKIPVFQLYNNKSANIEIPMSKTDRLIPISGRVYSNTGGRSPVFHALVVIGESITTTDEYGQFTVFVDSMIYNYDKRIRIIKNYYEYYESEIKPSNSTYLLKFKGDNMFSEEAKIIETLIDSAETSFKMSGRVYNNKGKYGDCQMYVNIEKKVINGYFYYIKRYNSARVKYHSYFIIKGVYDSNDNSFNCRIHDESFNFQDMKGIIQEDGEWKGTFSVFDDIRGTFSFHP